MKIKINILFIFLLLWNHFVLHSQTNKEEFTIYLIRHAEKDLSPTNPKDPALTLCGRQRADSLVLFFKEINLDVVYSSNYIRTINTGLPCAKSKNLEMTLYNPRELLSFAKLLLKQGEDALVVGHSNTTGVLAGLLAGKVIGPFDESIYNRIYKVVLRKEKRYLYIIHTNFTCSY